MTAINSSTLTQSEISRFMSYVRKDEQTGAWLWMAGKTDSGYGVFWLRGKTTGAHRVSWIIHRGEIPDGMYVCHKYEHLGCHNVNPNHLFLGTHTDNVRDAAAKGRTAWGQSNAKAKLTNNQSIEIHQSKEKGSVLAARYGVTETVISKIRRGLMWKHATKATEVDTHNLGNKSGYPGVRYKKGKWEAQLGWKENGKYCGQYIGRYDTPEAAHEAYLEAKKELHARRASLTPPLPPAP